MDVEYVVLEKAWAGKKAGTEILVDSARAETLVEAGIATRGRAKQPKAKKAKLKANSGDSVLRVLDGKKG